MNKLEKKIKITAEIELLTGMHIGDSSENVQIGGIDNSIIRRKDNYQPYIPGSSLKGKLRSLLEQRAGISDQKDRGNSISKLFGSTENKKENLSGNTSRIIVRDASLTKESSQKMNEWEFLDIPFAEIKVENSINRIKGTADSPRFMERVPAGAKFDINIVVNIFEDDNKEDLLNLLNEAKEMLELDYLGGSGSRGYGQVKFSEWKEEEIELDKILNHVK